MDNEKCPRCGGLLCPDNDEGGKYLTCWHCARGYDFNMAPRQISLADLSSLYGLVLTKREKGVILGEK